MLALRNSAPAIAVLILVMAACIGFGVSPGREPCSQQRYPA